MKIYGYHEHNGIFVKSQNWIGLDLDDDSEAIFLLLSLKNGELLKGYYESLPSENHEDHNHLRVSFNSLRFTDGDKYKMGLAIQHQGNKPIGFLLPLRSFEKEFCFDRIHSAKGKELHSKESEKYSDTIYRFILQLDSLMITLSENAVTTL
ncbi:hypothetical protein LFX25_03475 [Leptospira sp. FAT2]|uniref:hypothetical protein n=1 Tax=Leptospira sanjuanensis TaxID=2879643 RepID=UPI001EE81292|nr:hypothetical protein [Leptospira sanjuanensis]MCG6192300.1 hypothetical protein [Leptospira sanjuanensis]